MNAILGIPLRKPDIIFRSNGQFDLSARVVRDLNINPGDSIDILSDDSEFYLYVAHRFSPTSGRFRGRVYPSKPKSRSQHFRGCSAPLSRAILTAAGASDSASFFCGPPIVLPFGATALPIIIKSFKLI